MKKIIITVVMILGLYHAQAQDLHSEDSVVIDTTMLVENTPKKDKTTEAPPSNLSIKHQFGLGIIAWGQDDLNGRYVKDALSSEYSEQMSDVLNPINNYGFTLAYKLAFNPLKKADSLSLAKQCNLGYSTGIVFAGDFANIKKDAEFSWDLLASGGISLGKSNIGADVDLLLGLGAVNGYYLTNQMIELDDVGNTLENTGYYLQNDNEIVFKYGFQVAFKIGYINKGVLGSMFNALSSVTGNMSDVSFFVRFLMSTTPKYLSDEDELYIPLFPSHSIQIGMNFTF